MYAWEGILKIPLLLKIGNVLSWLMSFLILGVFNIFDSLEGLWCSVYIALLETKNILLVQYKRLETFNFSRPVNIGPLFWIGHVAC